MLSRCLHLQSPSPKVNRRNLEKSLIVNYAFSSNYILWRLLNNTAHASPVPTIIRNLSENLNVSVLHPLGVFFRTLENVAYFVFFLKTWKYSQRQQTAPGLLQGWNVLHMVSYACGAQYCSTQVCNCICSS